MRITNRAIKRFARISGGIGLGFYSNVVMFDSDLYLKGIALIILIISLCGFKMVRKRHSHEDKCKGCPELDKRGVCHGLQLEADQQREYSLFATDLLNPMLYQKFQAKHEPSALLDKNQEITSKNEFKFV